MLGAKEIDQFRALFKRYFDIELPAEFVCPGLQKIEGLPLLSTNPEELPRILRGKAPTVNEEFLVPVGHHTVGFWGYGVNSYYFYLIYRTPSERVYLRLPWAGAYANADQLAGEIANFSLAFSNFLQRSRTAGGSIFAVDSARSGFYQYVCDGLHAEIQASLLGSAHVAADLQALTDRDIQLARQENIKVNTAYRDSTLQIANEIYDVEMRRTGNQLVGMRAMKVSKQCINGIRLYSSPAEYMHELLMSLASLRERHRDDDGEHAHAKSCISQLMERISRSH